MNRRILLGCMALVFGSLGLFSCDSGNSGDPEEVALVPSTVTLRFDRVIFAFDKIALKLSTTSETLGEYTVVYTDSLKGDSSLTLQVNLPESTSVQAVAAMQFYKGDFSASLSMPMTLKAGFSQKLDASLSESMTICDPKAATGWGGNMLLSCGYRHLADSVGYWPLAKIDSVGLEGTWAEVSGADTIWTVQIDSVGMYRVRYTGGTKTRDSEIGYLSLEDSLSLRYWPVAYNIGGALVTSAMESSLWTLTRDSTGSLQSIGSLKRLK